MIHLLAQTVNNIPYMELGLGVASLGTILWLVRHVTTKTLPDLTERYEKTSAKQLESFERINRETRQEYREVLESDREMAYKREQNMRAEFQAAINKFEATIQQVQTGASSDSH